jgi:CheY-like chemotaxis protein
MGFAVDTALSGRQALRNYRGTRFDLILTDIEMPDMDGFALVQAIRRMETGNGRRTPILAITAADFKLTADAAAAAGFDGHMLKPLDVELLSVKLKAFAHPRPD